MMREIDIRNGVAKRITLQDMVTYHKAFLHHFCIEDFVDFIMLMDNIKLTYKKGNSDDGSDKNPG